MKTNLGLFNAATIDAIKVQHYLEYNANAFEGFSVPATEHSVEIMRGPIQVGLEYITEMIKTIPMIYNATCLTSGARYRVEGILSKTGIVGRYKHPKSGVSGTGLFSLKEYKITHSKRQKL